MGVREKYVLVQRKGFPEQADWTWQPELDLKSDLGSVLFYNTMQEFLLKELAGGMQSI